MGGQVDVIRAGTFWLFDVILYIPKKSVSSSASFENSGAKNKFLPVIASFLFLLGESDIVVTYNKNT
jgi:hypothetical protein